MATRIVMPQLGESLSEGTIGVWLKQEGDWVQEFEPLLEIETDKLTAEFPSPATGRLTKITVREGETVPIGEEIGWIEEEGESTGTQPEATAVATEADATTEATADAVGDAAPSTNTPAQVADAPAASAAAAGAKREYSPAVRKLAREHGLDAAALSQMPGTGQGGRVTKQDVLGSVEGGVGSATAGAVPPTAPDVAGEVAGERPGDDDGEKVPLSAIRRTIAERMVESVHNAPHGWMMVEVDMTQLVAMRNSEKAAFAEREGVPLTYLPFVIKAVVGGLKEVPRLNASWGGDHLLVHRPVHIGVSIGLEKGLVVPVIRDADEKSIAALARSVHEIIARARAGKLTYDELYGSTFTVNNTGAFGSILSVPILNPPEAGNLSMEAIVKRPVVVEDAIAIRSMMNLSLSVDHRVVDGLEAGRFLAEVKRGLEAYGPDTALW